MADVIVTLDQLISGEVPIPDAEDVDKEFVYRFLLPDETVGLFVSSAGRGSEYKDEVLKGLTELKVLLGSNDT